MTVAVYPGTFDPLTYGHVDIVMRAASLFDRVLVAVAANVNKQPWFALAARLAISQEQFSSIDNVDVVSFDGLLVNLVKNSGARVILRGLRSTADVEFEFQLAEMNRMLLPECDTLLMKASSNTALISSTMVREIAAMGGDITRFVPPAVVNRLTNQ